MSGGRPLTALSALLGTRFTGSGRDRRAETPGGEGHQSPHLFVDRRRSRVGQADRDRSPWRRASPTPSSTNRSRRRRSAALTSGRARASNGEHPVGQHQKLPVEVVGDDRGTVRERPSEEPCHLHPALAELAEQLEVRAHRPPSTAPLAAPGRHTVPSPGRATEADARAVHRGASRAPPVTIRPVRQSGSAQRPRWTSRPASPTAPTSPPRPLRRRGAPLL
jgi:hypothetical protein